MTPVGFFTPVLHKEPRTFRQYAQNACESFLPFTPKPVYIISPDKCNEEEVNNPKSNILSTALKIAVCVTLFIPLICAKLIYRSYHKFSISKKIDLPITPIQNPKTSESPLLKPLPPLNLNKLCLQEYKN